MSEQNVNTKTKPEEPKKRKKYQLKNTVSAITQRTNEINKYSMFGASALGFPEKISTVRGVMMVRHTSQRVVLRNPEFSYMYSGAENPFGQRSSWNIKAAGNWKLMKRFKKFNDIEDSPMCYIFLDIDTGKYKCILYDPAVNLMEKYGFQMSNNVKNYNEGDILPKGTIISQSSSYVNDNYCGGINARILYAVLPELTEDAIIISESFAKRLAYDMVDIVTVDIPENSYMLNRYGNSEVYKPFPDIGEEVKERIICSLRGNSMISSIAESSIPHINDTNYFAHGIIKDIDIYSNKEIDDAQFNYYEAEIKRYYSEIYSYISTIRIDKTQDDCTLIDMLNEAEKYLDSSPWVVKESTPNIQMKFKVLTPVEISIGQKIVGRYGNKSVIAGILPDEIMPKTDDGRHVDMLANGLAIPNRIIAFALYESEITFQSERMIQHIRKMYDEGKTIDEMMDMVIEFVTIYNEYDGNELRRVYNENPDEVFKDVIKNGIYIRVEPFGTCIRDAIIECYTKWPKIMKKYNIQTKLRHRWVTLPEKYAVGYQYTWVLKQEPSKAMSVLNSGRTTPYDVPVKTRLFNKNKCHYSNNPIKFGEYDTYSFMSGIGPRAFAKFTTYFRGSQYEDNSVLMTQLDNLELDTSKYNAFPQLDNLKNALKLMGLELKRDIFDSNTIGTIDETYDVYFGNVPVNISIPDLRYIMIMYSYYLQYDQYKQGMVDMTDFIDNMKNKTDTFKHLPDIYVDRIVTMFIELLPVLKQIKQYE